MRLSALVVLLVCAHLNRASPDVDPEEGEFFEGDIEATYNDVLANYGQAAADQGVADGVLPPPTPEQRGAGGVQLQLWPGGKVFYDFGSGITSEQQQKIKT